MSKISPGFLLNRNVLFVVDPSLGIDCKPFVDAGTVMSVDGAEQVVTVAFLFHGYKSTVEKVPFSHILAVSDTGDSASPLEMHRFRGYGYDLRGVPPFGSHELAKT